MKVTLTSGIQFVNVVMWSFVGLIKMADGRWEGWFVELAPWFIVCLFLFSLMIRIIHGDHK